MQSALRLPTHEKIPSFSLLRVGHREGNAAEQGEARVYTERAFTAEEEIFLKEVSALDYELFQFGRQLAANRTISAHHILHGRPR